MTENLSRFSLSRYKQPQVRSGLYIATLDDIGVGLSSSDTPMVVSSWKLNGSNWNKYLWRVPLTDSDIHKLVQVHKAFDLPTPSLPRLKAGTDVLDKDDYLNRTALVYLKAEWYQGKRRSIITEVRHLNTAWAFTAVAASEMTPDEPAENL